MTMPTTHIDYRPRIVTKPKRDIFTPVLIVVVSAVIAYAYGLMLTPPQDISPENPVAGAVADPQSD